MGTMKLQLGCICGAAAHGQFPDDLAPSFVEEWKRIHSGDRHAETTLDVARRARAASNRRDVAAFERRTREENRE